MRYDAGKDTNTERVKAAIVGYIGIRDRIYGGGSLASQASSFYVSFVRSRVCVIP